jgi:hypothetical protein
MNAQTGQDFVIILHHLLPVQNIIGRIKGKEMGGAGSTYDELQN